MSTSPIDCEAHLARFGLRTFRPGQREVVEALGIAGHELLESVEYRRRRNLRPGTDPWWLTGEAAGAPAPTMAAPARAAVPRHEASDRGYEAHGFADFIQEISDLAAPMGEKERAVLLDLARKLAARYR